MTILSEAKRLVGAPIPHFLADLNGLYTYVNPAWCELTGLEPGDAMGSGWMRTLDPGAAEYVRTSWLEFVTAGGFFREEFCFVHPPTGQRRWARTQAGRLLDELDHPIGFWGWCTEVTDLYRATDALTERAQLLEMCDARMGVGQWYLSTSDQQVQWSREVHRIHGTDPQTYRPTLTAALEAYHPDDRERVTSIVRGALLNSSPFGFEARIIRADGSLRRVRSAGVCARGGDETPKLVGIFQDITEQSNLLGRLRESEKRYEMAVAASQDGLWDWNLESGEVWCSPRYQSILGLDGSSSQAGGHPFRDRVHDEDREAVMSAIERHLDGGVGFDAVLRLRHQSGRWIWVRAKAEIDRDAEGKAIRMVGIAADVSAEVESKAILERKTRELERSNAELERFASVASHDLKEPLRKIRAFSDRILNRGGIEHPGILQDLERIRSSADRMAAMVDDLLELARVPTRSHQREAVDLNRVVRRVLERLSDTVAEVRADVSVETLPAVLANATQMEQVYFNLLENALKYRSPHRDTRIRVRNPACDRAGYVRLLVEDNGIGFEPIYAIRIFLLFERLHGRSAYPGTGLGLALCKRIIEEHGGTIEAVGQPNEGSSFVFELPMALGAFQEIPRG